MYMPAEPKLLEYAYRVKQDVPFEADVVKFEQMTLNAQSVVDVGSEDVTFHKERKASPALGLELGGFDNLIDRPVFDGTNETIEEHFLTSSYEKVINIFGRFQQEAIALGLSELR